MIEFVTNHWDIIATIVAVAAVVIFLALKGKKQIVYKILYALVTEAERQFGSGTGKLKFAWVMEKLYAALPTYIRAFITYGMLEKWIEEALTEAKEEWAKEAGIVE